MWSNCWVWWSDIQKSLFSPFRVAAEAYNNYLWQFINASSSLSLLEHHSDSTLNCFIRAFTFDDSACFFSVLSSENSPISITEWKQRHRWNLLQSTSCVQINLTVNSNAIYFLLPWLFALSTQAVYWKQHVMTQGAEVLVFSIYAVLLWRSQDLAALTA